MAGFLERVFQDYDYIRTQRPSRMEHIAPASTPASFKPKPDDTPPWVEPPKAENPPMAEKPPTVTDVASQDNDGFAKIMGGSLAIKGLQSQAAQAVNYNALRTAPEFEALPEPLLGGDAAIVSAAEGVALGAAEIVPGIALGALAVSAVDRLERNQ